MNERQLVRLLWCFVCCWSLENSWTWAQSLESDLQRIPLSELVQAARTSGDAARGAVVFFQPQMACAKCHVAGGQESQRLGPDLTKLPKETTDESLVESILFPSKVIRQGFESISIRTTEGNTISAFLVKKTDEHLVIRDISQGGEVSKLPHSEIEAVKQNEQSIMPSGQANQLNSRQQFLDLVRYLIEIREGGEARALQLKPSAALLAFTVPEYENHLDHAGLISGWNDESWKRGEATYQRVCANCHGTKEKAGSLPTSLRFAEGKFKNGSDPLSLYRTLTHGFGLMAPQTWMVPSQKYDVIHYIREEYLRRDNPSQLAKVDAVYLASIPKGDTMGPEPSTIESWSAMDYGSSLTHSFEVPGSKHNIAYKGVAVRLDPGAGGVSRGRHWMLFDTDTLRVAAGWNANKESENFMDWKGIQFNGEHGIHPRIVGETAFANSTGPGWANPANAEFLDDQRVLGRDQKRYGPLPREWGKFKGLYHHGQQVIFSYSIGHVDILESPRVMMPEDPKAKPLFLRSFNIGPRDRDLVLQVAESLELGAPLPIAGLAPRNVAAEWISHQGSLRLRIPAGKEPLRFTIWLPSDVSGRPDSSVAKVSSSNPSPVIPDADIDLQALTHGGPPRWPQVITTQAILGSDGGPFAIDQLTAPESNPWLAQTRFTGLDFFADGRIAICSWDGDVWIVTPATDPLDATLRWQRIATGMFQPLGLKIVNEKIHLTCRDQLAVLHDLNQDGEIDFYECLNNDHQVTEHFHEFAMGLQTDAEGNFYYAKSGCHGKAAVVPHHGTLLRVSADGSTTEILANGFRAANGVCLNPDGSFVVTDQEGFWNPKNRINWVTVPADGKPNFYGNMLGYHDVTDSSDAAMVPPLCWITNDFDRSPAELLWVDSPRWGKLQGGLLNLSYGYGKVFLVLHEKVNDKMQGGMIELPIPIFPTGVMRGRFHPGDGQLYLCGMFAWAGNATYPGGLYRMRATGKSLPLPVAMHATQTGIQLRFAEKLDPISVAAEHWNIKTWGLKRTANYGSKHLNEKRLEVQRATLAEDGQTVTLEIANVSPTWCMEVQYTVRTATGELVQGTIHNTIHDLGE